MTPAPKSNELRSPCPVAATLDLMGDRWTLLIIRDLFAGKSRYREFATSPEGIATNILASRLASLQAGGLVVAHQSSSRTGRSEYRLTDKGRSLLPVLRSMRDWGLANVPGTAAIIRPAAAVHTPQSPPPRRAPRQAKAKNKPPGSSPGG